LSSLRPPHFSMYPIIEFLTGAYFVLAYYAFGITLPTFKWLFFGCLLIVLIVTDLLVRLLPTPSTSSAGPRPGLRHPHFPQFVPGHLWTLVPFAPQTSARRCGNH